MDYNQNGQNNQNNGQWDRWNSDSSNSSYYNQPTHRPYRQGFMMASGICGLLAVSTCCTGIFSLAFGAMGVLFAVLASRKGKKLNGTCVMGIVFSAVGMLGGLFMLIYTFAMFPTLMQDEAYRTQLDMVTEATYGMDFAEFMEEFYGYTIEE